MHTPQTGEYCSAQERNRGCKSRGLTPPVGWIDYRVEALFVLRLFRSLFGGFFFGRGFFFGSLVDDFLFGGFVFDYFIVVEGGFFALLADTIADADELKDRLGTGIAETRRGELEDSSVAAVSIGKTGADLVEEDLDGLLITQQPQCTPPCRHDRSNGLIPFLPLLALPPRSPPIGSAVGVGFQLVGGLLVPKAASCDRDTLLDKRTNFLRLVERRDDSTLDLRGVRVELGVPLREEQRGGEVLQESPLVTWIAAEFTAFSSMSHGCSID